MCRWLAYSGSPISLDTLLFRPSHSLIDQSFRARQNYVTGTSMTAMFRDHALPTNGDGFGIGWYTKSAPTPGQYRDLQPAWNDGNLRRISEHVVSPLFLAHVRAAIGGTVSRQNCHPFQHGRWLFQYNGEINGFRQLKRELTFDVAPELYPSIEGNADTEVCFFLALTYGLADDPPRGLARMVSRVERARRENGITEPFRASMAATDGETIYAVRYSSDRASKTLYHSQDVRRIRTAGGPDVELPPDSHILVSEPLELEYRDTHWVEIPEWSLVTVRTGAEPVITPFEPVE